MIADGSWQKAVDDQPRPGRLQAGRRQPAHARRLLLTDTAPVRRPLTPGGRRTGCPHRSERQPMADLFTQFDILGAFWMTIDLTVLLGHRRPGDRHGRGHHAGLAGADPAAPRHQLRQRRPQHPADADHGRSAPRPVLSTSGCSLADPNSPTFMVDNNIRLGVLGPVGLPRGVRLRGAAQRHQHRAHGPGRGRPLDRADLHPDACATWSCRRRSGAPSPRWATR